MSVKCGCKGVRSCLLCEATSNSGQGLFEEDHKVLQYFQCRVCGLAFRRNFEGFVCHPTCTPQGAINSVLEFRSVTVIENFVDEKEERSLVEEIDAQGWAESQSGRRKQDYGPKVNFKRQRVQLGLFNGLPSFIKPVLSRMNSDVAELKDFVPVELCCLDYQPERGAAIDPHTDDSWIWGEKLVTLNLLSSTILTFSTSPSVAAVVCTIDPTSTSETMPTVEVEVQLPQRSLVIVEGLARHEWLHSIKRQHITLRRVAVTLRELTPEFLPGGQNEAIGRTISDRASGFNGHPINLNRTF